MKSLTDIITQLIEENRNAYHAHRAKVEKRAEELNAGWARTRYGRDYFAEVVQPTWGVDDRPHAPFDGYLWEGENGEIEAYGGGQYLPYVNEIERFDKMEYTGDHGWWKIRLTAAMYVELKLFGCPIEVREPYKSWELEDFTTVMMVEVRAHRSILEAIQSHSQETFNIIYDNLKKFKGAAPEGRVVLIGTVRSVKVYEGYYGVEAKMTVVLENGATVYGSVPSSMDIEFRGKVEFTATCTPAKDDNTHAFFKRPSKFKTLTE